jgi:XTP/dITP diphosphohydrolase
VTLPERIVVASANPKKAAELAELLSTLPVEVVPRPPEVPEVIEDGDTFEDNARLKAVALAAATGEVSLADDSGLEVDELDGAPGVFSARYAGESASDADNVVRVLVELDRRGAVESSRRTARFRCVLVLRWPDGTELVTDGAVEGRLADAPVGEQGFGYDPVFVPAEGDGRTFAQMSTAEKQSISHRGRALRALVARLTA